MESGVGAFGDRSLTIENCITNFSALPGNDANASVVMATNASSADGGGVGLSWHELCEAVMSSILRPAPDPRRHAREMLNYLLMGVAGMTVGCFGLVGNLLSAIVLTRRTMKTSTYCYLAALAVCDFLVVACTVVLLIKVRTAT